MDLERLQSELDMTGRVSTWATRQLITEVERLRAENEKLKTNQELWGSIELITAQKKENEQLREALERLKRMNLRQAPELNNKLTEQSLMVIEEALKEAPND